MPRRPNPAVADTGQAEFFLPWSIGQSRSATSRGRRPLSDSTTSILETRAVIARPLCRAHTPALTLARSVWRRSHQVSHVSAIGQTALQH